MNCSNCKAQLGCSCKVRTASDKTSCCTLCLGTYEASLAQKKHKPGSPNDATNVKVVYNGPGRQH